MVEASPAVLDRGQVESEGSPCGGPSVRLEGWLAAPRVDVTAKGMEKTAPKGR